VAFILEVKIIVAYFIYRCYEQSVKQLFRKMLFTPIKHNISDIKAYLTCEPFNMIHIETFIQSDKVSSHFRFIIVIRSCGYLKWVGEISSVKNALFAMCDLFYSE